MRLVVGLIVATLSAAACSGVARASDGDVEALYRQVLRSPTDTQTNLRYARAAEASGQLRWALAAYERMLVNDPDNDDVQKGLQRLRRKLQPNSTQFSLEVGGIYESNPRYSSTVKSPEAQLFTSLGVRDERNIGDLRWRTTGSVAAWVHDKEDQLNYLHGGGVTGPVVDVGGRWALHLGVGGGAAYFNHRFFYNEAVAQATLEGYLDGAYRAIQVRGAYRTYDSAFPSTEGFYGDITGRFHFPDVIGADSLLVVSPWVRWSDIGGTGFSQLFTEVQPGAYYEYGVRTELMKAVTNWMVLGPTFSVFQRHYRKDVVAFTTDKRRDLFIVPGATAIFPNLFAYQVGLRLDYKYINDISNDGTRKFIDHVTSATVFARF